MSLKLRNLTVACLLLALLTACGEGAAGSAGDGAAPRGEVDYNQYTGAPGIYVYTDSAYLSFHLNQIRFLEPSLTAPLSLMCSKVECGHDDGSCPAHLEGYGLTAYGEHLYYIDSPGPGCDEIRLCRMDLTGENRTVLSVLRVDGSGYTYITETGGGYFTLNLFALDLVGQVNTLYLFSLADSQPEPIVLYTNRDYFDWAQPGEIEGKMNFSTGFPGIPQVYSVFHRDGWIFYSVVLDGEYQLYGYETGTGETSLIMEDWSSGGCVSLRNSLLYWYTPEKGLCSTDLATGDTVEYLVPPASEGAYNWGYDDSYFYLFSQAGPGLTVYGYEGNLVQELSFDGLGITLGYALSTPDYIFFRDFDDYIAFDYACYVEKAALARGEAAFIPLK